MDSRGNDRDFRVRLNSRELLMQILGRKSKLDGKITYRMAWYDAGLFSGARHLTVVSESVPRKAEGSARVAIWTGTVVDTDLVVFDGGSEDPGGGALAA